MPIMAVPALSEMMPFMAVPALPTLPEHHGH